MILFFPFDLLSHYLRCLQLAKSFTGVEIKFPYSAKYHHLVAEAGFGTFPYQGLPTQEVMESAAGFSFPWMQEEILEKAFLEQVKVIQQFRPTLVIGDADFTLRMAAAYTGVPHVSLINGYMSAYYAVTKRLPKDHPINRLFFFLPNKLFARISVQTEKVVLRHVHAPFRRIAKKYGIQSKAHLLQELQGELTLIVDLPELFPQKSLPSHHKQIGPLFHLSRGEEDHKMRSSDNAKKTIFVSVGSSGDMSKFRFLEEECYSKYHILIAGKSDYLWKAAHVQYFEFVHLEQVLASIDLFICHGGNGTIYQALQAGIPVLCAPANFEQEWNLQGLERAEVGERLAPSNPFAQIEEWCERKGTGKWKDLSSKIDIQHTLSAFQNCLNSIAI